MEEKEVDLRDYIRVIKKRKKVILLIFIVAVISSGVISFFLPPTYEVTSTLRIGEIIDVDTLQRTPIESSIAVSEFLKGPKILTETIKDLKLPFTLEKMKEKVSVSPVRETKDLVQINVEMSNPKVALDVANYLTNKLLQRHRKIKTLYENEKELLIRYDQRIADIQKELSGIEKNKEEILTQYDQKIKDIDKEIPILKNGISQTKKKIEEMTKRSESLSQAESQILVGYMNYLKGKQDRYDSLMKEIRDLELAKTELKKSKQDRYDKLTKELSDTQFAKAELERRDPLKMYPTEVIVSPYEPEKPIGPRKLLNVLVTAVISLIVGVGIAFSLEYFEKPE